ncbi:MAG: hypothetical protein AAB646_01590 [Patescibacteria group bacterium]
MSRQGGMPLIAFLIPFIACIALFIYATTHLGNSAEAQTAVITNFNGKFSPTLQMKLFSQEVKSQEDVQKLESDVNKWLQDNYSGMTAMIGYTQTSGNGRLDVAVWYVPKN